MNKKIVITGATGLIGRKIFLKLIERGDEVTVFTRSIDNAKKLLPGALKYIFWNLSSTDWQEELEGKDAIINLAGESLMAKRWTEVQKKNIYESRINTTRKLVDAIAALKNKPKVLVSASAIGYYGNSETEVDESSGEGSGFLAALVSDWEKETQRVANENVRQVSVRIGIVLDKNEGALAKMITPYKFFIGGPLGNGKQWMPWIHIDDLANIFLFALDNENVNGIINGVSPNPVRMDEFAKTIGKVLHRPSFFRIPAIVLKTVLGESAIVVLEGAKVKSKKLHELNFKFMHTSINESMKKILV